MTTATATLTVSLSALLTNALDLVTPAANLAYAKNKSFTNGTGADKIQAIFSDTRSLTTGANEDLDLAGSLTSALGATITFTKVKALLISSAAANTTNLSVGPAASNGWAAAFGDASDKIVVRPGGMLLLTAPDANGLAVTAGTGDLLNIANSAGATASYDIIILGE